MSNLANLLWQAYVAESRFSHTEPDRELSQMRLDVAVEQFVRATGPEQADVIRMFCGQARPNDDKERYIYQTRAILHFLGQIQPHMHLDMCKDDFTRSRIQKIFENAGFPSRTFDGPNCASVDWLEVARCIEGERRQVVFSSEQERWSAWFKREFDRHVAYFKRHPAGYLDKKDNLIPGGTAGSGGHLSYSTDHAIECREAAKEGISPSQFYARRLESIRRAISEHNGAVVQAVPLHVEECIRVLEDRVAKFRKIAALAGRDRALGFEAIWREASEEIRIKDSKSWRKEDPSESRDAMHLEMLKTLGL